MQPVDVQLIADFFEQAQFGLLQGAIGGGHITGQRIGGFKQMLGQVVADQAKERIQPLFLAKQVKDGLRHDVHPVEIVIGKNRQVVHCGFDFEQFGGADILVRGGDRDHDRDEAILRCEGMGGLLGHWDILLKQLCCSAEY